MCSKGFLGGIVTGALLGAAVGMLADPISDKQHRKIKSSASHMFKTIGAVIDGVMDSM
ncbi:MAG: YtxH domain-containing protein [Clostridia bacterium]|nr:YtxH domain-containing protein [Clostridia bacterium]